jgi:hypothetical protein
MLGFGDNVKKHCAPHPKITYKKDMVNQNEFQELPMTRGRHFCIFTQNKPCKMPAMKTRHLIVNFGSRPCISWPSPGKPATVRLGTGVLLPLLLALVFAGPNAHAQQFNSDNQWTAPHGVGTLIATVGQEYSSILAVAALFPDWEFNVGNTSYYKRSDGLTEKHNTGVRRQPI